jgi:protein TonB
MSLPENNQGASAPRDTQVREPAGKPPAAERNSLSRYGAALAVIAILFGGVAWFFSGHDDMPPPRQVRDLTIVNIMPPPPPPPPPPPMPEQKMIEQPKMADPQIKEEKPVDQPKDEPVKDAKNDEPPGPLSLDAKPVGPGDLFNLGGKPGGNPYGGGGGGGSRWGWYSAIVSTQAHDALIANPRTRSLVAQMQIRLWADATGRVTRVVLGASTGDAELDAIIRNEVLGKLMLREPPPKDMPMPVVTRVTAQRPS